MSVAFLLSCVTVVGETAMCAEYLSYDINKIYIRIHKILFRWLLPHAFRRDLKEGRTYVCQTTVFFFRGNCFYGDSMYKVGQEPVQRSSSWSRFIVVADVFKISHIFLQQNILPLWVPGLRASW